MAIVGLGKIGLTYDEAHDAAFTRTHTLAVMRHPAFSLLAGIDPSSDRRRAFEIQTQAPSFESLKQFRPDTSPDVLIISTPTEHHSSSIELAVESMRPRVILCEKPLAPTFEMANHLNHLCEGLGTRLVVNYPRRATPGAAKVLEWVKSGSLGRSIRGVSIYSNGLLQNGIHSLDLLEFWLGPILQHELLDSTSNTATLSSSPDLRLTFAESDVFLIGREGSNLPTYTFRLFGDSGEASYGETDGFAVTLRSHKLDRAASPSQYIHQPNGIEHYQYHVLDAVRQLLDGDDTILTSGRSAARHVGIATGIFEEPV